MLSALILSTLFGIFGWTCFAVFFKKVKRTNQLLIAVCQEYNQTPVKQLAADFRSFVQSYDGSIGKEMDAFIKRLEDNVENNEQNTKRVEREEITEEQWKCFIDDWKLEKSESRDDKDDIVAVIKRWGAKYIFTIIHQQAILNCFEGQKCKKIREDLRIYFDKYHKI